MIKYLLIGSAPYIVDWYRDNGKKYLDAGYKLVALNNAWSIDSDNLSMWVHSDDYYKVAKNQPNRKMLIKLDGVERLGISSNEKYSYVKQGSGVMILNCLTALLNRALMKKLRVEVCVAGCDCIYPDGQQTHFYGESTKDPLRFGEDYLKTEFNRIMGFYYQEKMEIYNVGGREETLLPFPRKEL